MPHYLYCITNKTNNKSYVGQTENYEERWKNHKRDALRQTKKKSARHFAFQNALIKYGIENFTWQIIEQVDTLEESNEAEEFYIAYLQTLAPNGYNILRGGNNRTLSQATKEKIRMKLKIVGSFVGKKGKDHPNFGTTLSEGRKQALSIMKSGDNGPNKKINSTIAYEIYIEYLNNPNITGRDLAKKYNLRASTISNILNKKSWKEVLKDLPVLNIEERHRGETLKNSKLKNQDVIDIRNMYATGNYTMENLATKYSITSSAVSNIISRKYWKHIKSY